MIRTLTTHFDCCRANKPEATLPYRCSTGDQGEDGDQSPAAGIANKLDELVTALRGRSSRTDGRVTPHGTVALEGTLLDALEPTNLSNPMKPSSQLTTILAVLLMSSSVLRADYDLTPLAQYADQLSQQGVRGDQFINLVDQRFLQLLQQAGLAPGNAPGNGMGAYVQQMHAQGLRGPALAAAIHTEQQRRGIGQGNGKPGLPPGSSAGKTPPGQTKVKPNTGAPGQGNGKPNAGNAGAPGKNSPKGPPAGAGGKGKGGGGGKGKGK